MLALKKMDRGNLEMAQIFPFCVKIREHFQWMQRYNILYKNQRIKYPTNY